MKYSKILKTFLIIAALSVMIFSAAHSLADDDDGEEDEYDKKAQERRWEQEKKELEKEREAAKKLLEKNLEEQKKEVAQPPVVAPQPTVIREVEQIITEKIPVDTDGDFVPDEFDEYPGEDDFAYLTDSDKDGAPDALDKHPGENDAAYAVSDLNENGIVDEAEALAGSPR